MPRSQRKATRKRRTNRNGPQHASLIQNPVHRPEKQLQDRALLHRRHATQPKLRSPGNRKLRRKSTPPHSELAFPNETRIMTSAARLESHPDCRGVSSRLSRNSWYRRSIRRSPAGRRSGSACVPGSCRPSTLRVAVTVGSMSGSARRWKHRYCRGCSAGGGGAAIPSRLLATSAPSFTAPPGRRGSACVPGSCRPSPRSHRGLHVRISPTTPMIDPHGSRAGPRSDGRGCSAKRHCHRVNTAPDASRSRKSGASLRGAVPPADPGTLAWRIQRRRGKEQRTRRPCAMKSRAQAGPNHRISLLSRGQHSTGDQGPKPYGREITELIQQVTRRKARLSGS